MQTAHLILSAILELIASALISILIDRLFSTRAALIALFFCLAGVGYLNWGEIRPIFVRAPPPQPIAPPSSTPPAAAAFSVDIETRIFIAPGPNGTGFWFGTFLPTACSLEPIQAAIFLRMVNLQDHKEMITAYSAKFGEVPLVRVQVPRGRIFLIYGKGQLKPGVSRPGASLDIGSPEGLGSIVSFPIKDVDPSVAAPLTGNFLDDKLGENSYLQPYEPARGWAFFRYPPNTFAMPTHLTISITDALQRTFSYLLPDHLGDPGGDTLSRKLTPAPTEDLSGCRIVN